MIILRILAVLLACFLLYYSFNPKELVITRDLKMKNSRTNKLRIHLNGQRFWENQKKAAYSELSILERPRKDFNIEAALKSLDDAVLFNSNYILIDICYFLSEEEKQQIKALRRKADSIEVFAERKYWHNRSKISTNSRLNEMRHIVPYIELQSENMANRKNVFLVILMVGGSIYFILEILNRVINKRIKHSKK